jgi:hypothetical protein
MLGEDGEPDVVDEVGKPEVGDADEPGGVVRALGAVTFPSSLNHNNGPQLRARTSASAKPDAIPDVMRVATAEEGAASNVEA